MKCCVQSCTNESKYAKSLGISFYKFPKDPDICTAWVQGLGMGEWLPGERSTICSQHFNNEDVYETYGGQRKIKNGAIPFVIQDSEDDLNAPATFRVCRICLAMDKKMYDIRQNELDQIFEQVTGFLVGKEDGLPQRLCWECAHRLVSCFKIRSKALHSQALMVDMLEPGGCITMRDIKSVNRTRNQLKSNLTQKIYESDDYDVHIQDSELVKLEFNNGEEEEKKFQELDNSLVITEVAVKYENTDEFIDSCEETEEDKISEIYIEKKKNIVKKKKHENTSTILENNPTTYKNHLRIKHVASFVCELCGYTFVNNHGVQVHKRMKHPFYDLVASTGPYCEVCDVRFLSEEAYSRHLKMSSKHISGSDPNVVKTRMRTTRKNNTVKKIQRRSATRRRDFADQEEASELLACEQCGLQLPNPRTYTMHFKREHPDKNRTRFLSRTALCMCEQCGRIFQCLALLQDHMTVHADEKLFKCELCPKRFAQKTKLVFHMRVHKQHRPSYECPLCEKTFTQAENRRRHMLIHAGIRPYKCDTCGKCFTTSTEMRAHVKHVHLKDPWPKRVRSRSRHVKKSSNENSRDLDSDNDTSESE